MKGLREFLERFEINLVDKNPKLEIEIPQYPQEMVQKFKEYQKNLRRTANVHTNK